MKVKINQSHTFKKEAKRFAKRYASFCMDYENLLNELTENPLLGTDLGNGIRKIRMRIMSKGKGKSGGLRVISVNVYASVTETTVNLLYIYDKSERSSINRKEIERLMRQNGL